MTVTYCAATDVYRAAGLSTSDVSEADVEEFIQDAEAEVDEWTGKKYVSTSATEYYEGSPREVSITSEVDEGVFYEVPREEKREIILDHYPVISITSLQWIDDDGTVNTSLTENTDYHLWNSTGKVWIFTKNIPFGDNKKKVKVIYTYGTSTVPRNIKKLTETIAGIMCMIKIMGGSYDDATSYSIPELSVALGEPWVNLQRTLVELEKNRDRLFAIVGRSIPTVVV